MSVVERSHLYEKWREGNIADPPAQSAEYIRQKVEPGNVWSREGQIEETWTRWKVISLRGLAVTGRISRH